MESGECEGVFESKGKGSRQGFTCMRGDVGAAAAAAAAAADGDTAAGRLLPGRACTRGHVADGEDVGVKDEHAVEPPRWWCMQ